MKRIARATVIMGITASACLLAAPAAMAGTHHKGMGHGGPTVVKESGPGNLNFSSISKSSKVKSAVGNESVKTGDISTSLKGGKGNTVVNEVEGSEQDSIKVKGNKYSSNLEAGAQERHGDKGGKKSGHGGPFVKESGPGNLNFSSISKSSKVKSAVGNESVKTGNISTSLKGGKGNTVVNEVEGSEQDSAKSS